VNDGSTEFKEQDVWIALEPEQIKSAIGNTGAFGESNPDIRFSRSAAPTGGNLFDLCDTCGPAHP
jgi:hypothetical protein